MAVHRLSKMLFLSAAGLSFLLSVYLWFVVGNKEQGLFVGLWVPSILTLGTLLTQTRKEEHHV
ncbi:MAG: hypothetical protein HOP18_14710 [Deltaproteobacteria bacterium]|nr:hypothetical protein [Deltaproteobacteria bacterium]